MATIVHTRKRLSSALFATTVALGTLTACSDTSGASAGGDTCGKSDASLSGEPIKVMSQWPVNTSLPSYPQGLIVADCFERWVNDNGGIEGRPLDVLVCDDRGDATAAVECARKAIEEDVVAMVGSFSWNAEREISILDDADIAWFGANAPVVQAEFTSDNSFITGSLFSFPAAEAWRAAQDGCEAPAALQQDVAIKDLFFDQMRSGFAAAGFDPEDARYISLPTKTQDYSSQVAQATDGTDCIIGSMSEDNWAAFLPAFEAAGGDQRLYGPQGQLNGKIANQFPESTEGAVVINTFPNLAEPVWDDFRGALDEYGVTVEHDWSGPAGVGVWAAFTAFKNIIESGAEIDNVAFLEAASNTKQLETGGMTPVLDLTEEFAGLGGDFPRTFNRFVTFDVVKDGQLEPTDDGFVDMTPVMQGQPLESS